LYTRFRRGTRERVQRGERDIEHRKEEGRSCALHPFRGKKKHEKTELEGKFPGTKEGGKKNIPRMGGRNDGEKARGKLGSKKTLNQRITGGIEKNRRRDFSNKTLNPGVVKKRIKKKFHQKGGKEKKTSGYCFTQGKEVCLCQGVLNREDTREFIIGAARNNKKKSSI